MGHRILAHAEKGAYALWDAKTPGVAKTEFDAAVVALPSYELAHYGLGAYFRQAALQRHDPALLARSSDEFDKAAELDKNPALATTARADNDRLASRVKATP